MRFTRFLSGGFITAIVVKPPEKKLVNVVCERHLGFVQMSQPTWFAKLSFWNSIKMSNVCRNVAVFYLSAQTQF